MKKDNDEFLSGRLKISVVWWLFFFFFKSNIPSVGVAGFFCTPLSGGLLDFGLAGCTSPPGLWTVAWGAAPTFRVGAIPRGIPLRICMEAWGANCARIAPGALGRARK